MNEILCEYNFHNPPNSTGGVGDPPALVVVYRFRSDLGTPGRWMKYISLSFPISTLQLQYTYIGTVYTYLYNIINIYHNSAWLYIFTVTLSRGL